VPADRRDLGGRQRLAGPAQHLGSVLGVGATGELGGEVRDRHLVGSRRLESRDGRRSAVMDEFPGRAGVAVAALAGRFGRELAGKRDRFRRRGPGGAHVLAQRRLGVGLVQPTLQLVGIDARALGGVAERRVLVDQLAGEVQDP
jgi:hypothetical protein